MCSTANVGPRSRSRRTSHVPGTKFIGDRCRSRGLALRRACEQIAAIPGRRVAAYPEIHIHGPSVFASAIDPVSGGLIASLAHPGGNVTGFAQGDFGLGAKSLELLKQIAPCSRG
jgi:hypothetical protein